MCNGCEDLELLSELNECSCHEIFPYTSGIFWVQYGAMVRVLAKTGPQQWAKYWMNNCYWLTYLIIFFSLFWFDHRMHFTNLTSPTKQLKGPFLHAKEKIRSCKFKILNAQLAEDVVLRGGGGAGVLWTIGNLLETNKRQGNLKVDWTADILGLMRCVRPTRCIKTWNRCFFFFQSRFYKSKMLITAKLCAYHVPIILVFAVVYLQQQFPENGPPTSGWHPFLHHHPTIPRFCLVQVRSFQQHAEPGNLRKSVFERKNMMHKEHVGRFVFK